MGRSSTMVLDYRDAIRLWPTAAQKASMAALVLAVVAFPFLVDDPFWTAVLVYAGIAAVGALGLNLLTGYTGQVSLGHAFFIGTGAYVGSYLSRGATIPFTDTTVELPMILWLPGAAIAGGLIGAFVGPFALRLRGNYLVIVTLGLVFIGQHLFNNWDSFTGGPQGTRSLRAEGVDIVPTVTLGGLDFRNLTFLGKDLTASQGFFYLVWIVVGISALALKNIVRSRPGRALQAVRDRDIAAEVVGVSLSRYKIGAFVVSSGLAALAGALLGAYSGTVNPINYSIFLSIQYVAMIIVGGLATIFGSILGALFLTAMPELVTEYSGQLGDLSRIPGTDVVLVGPSSADPLINEFAFNNMMFGVLIVVFLVAEPRGLAALWLRAKAYFKAWPFSY